MNLFQCFEILINAKLASLTKIPWSSKPSELPVRIIDKIRHKSVGGGSSAESQEPAATVQRQQVRGRDFTCMRSIKFKKPRLVALNYIVTYPSSRKIFKWDVK